jgi:hypothetical protein
MNCEINLIEEYLKKEFPYVVKVKNFNSVPSPINPSEQQYSLDIIIKFSFFYQLNNNGLLSNNIITSFTKISSQIINNVCPETIISPEILIVSFISDNEI